MKLFALTAAIFSLALPAAAQSAFELTAAPAANRDKIANVNGQRTFTEAHGWYTMTMEADTTFSADGAVRFFTYAPSGDYVKVGISALPATDDKPAGFTFDDVQENMDFFRDPAKGSTPAYVIENIVAPEIEILELGNGNGKTPAMMAVWIGKIKSEPNAAPVVVMANLLPRGDLIIFVDSSTPEAGKAIIRQHFRFAEGVLE